MSGIVAAAQSAGCCCRPAPNVGCSLQLLRPWICGQSERWNELAVQVSGSVVFSQQAIPGITPNGTPCACYGGTQLATASVPSFFLSKATTPYFPGPCLFDWRLRNEIEVGQHGATNSDCYTEGTLCCYEHSPPPCNGFCATGRYISSRGPRFHIGIPFAPTCGFTQDTVEVCTTCPSGPQRFARTLEIPASGPVILKGASIGIESGFTISPCGAPTAGTPVQWVLQMTANPYYICDGERIYGGAGGYTLRYVKPCCSYLDGPVGTYTLQGDPNQSYTQQTECLITQLTAQFSPTAIVTEVPD